MRIKAGLVVPNRTRVFGAQALCGVDALLISKCTGVWRPEVEVSCF